MADFRNFHIFVFYSCDGESPTTIYTQTYSTPESVRALVGSKGNQKTLIGHANTGKSRRLFMFICLSSGDGNSNIKSIEEKYNEVGWALRNGSEDHMASKHAQGSFENLG